MDKYYWAYINACSYIGNSTIEKIKSYFPNPKDFLDLNIGEIQKSNILKRNQLEAYESYRRNTDFNNFYEEIKTKNIKIISKDEDDYPEMLKNTYNSPYILYVKGNLPKTNDLIGIVGSRKSSAYGEQVAKDFAKELAKYGFTIVSGAALGIDAAAHWGAIENGYTIGVLGCGIDIVYPAKNKKLYDAICENGAIISEYPLKTPPLATNFPPRNRIIAGLSKGILVVEGALKSGSLITAELANNEGRDVFAIPSNIYSPNSKGVHKLIQDGAKLVTCVEDIICEYKNLDVKIKTKIDDNKKEFTLNLSKEESIVYNILDFSVPKSVDEIIYKTRDQISNIAILLLQMKIKDIVCEVAPNQYVKK